MTCNQLSKFVLIEDSKSPCKLFVLKILGIFEKYLIIDFIQSLLKQSSWPTYWSLFAEIAGEKCLIFVDHFLSLTINAFGLLGMGSIQCCGLFKS